MGTGRRIERRFAVEGDRAAVFGARLGQAAPPHQRVNAVGGDQHIDPHVFAVGELKFHALRRLCKFTQGIAEAHPVLQTGEQDFAQRLPMNAEIAARFLRLLRAGGQPVLGASGVERGKLRIP